MLNVDVRSAIGRPVTGVVRCLEPDGSPTANERSPLFAPLVDRLARHGTAQIFGRHDGSYLPVDYVATPMTERDPLTGVGPTFNGIPERPRAGRQLHPRPRRPRARFT